MAGRAAHYRAKNKHAQRQFGEAPKAKLAPVGSDTVFLADFLQAIQGTEPFNIDSPQAHLTGATEEERLRNLRTASKLGVLRMYAHHENGEFVEYRWELTASGTL